MDLLLAMFIGMHDEALKPIRRSLTQMEEYGPPSGTEPAWPNELICSRDKAIKWWATLGLGRWIAEGETGVKEFGGAANHVHQQWQGEDPGHLPVAREGDVQEKVMPGQACYGEQLLV